MCGEVLSNGDRLGIFTCKLDRLHRLVVLNCGKTTHSFMKTTLVYAFAHRPLLFIVKIF